ncbi:MAG: transcriptional repressor LexA [Deltaproteobacteria bacterium]|nr:transcriptional repressor LexA [Deltaproteobacteria bacterium]
MATELRSPLTARQQSILDFIKASIRERGYPPSLREIGMHMGIKSTNGVNDHLTALERKGYLRRDSMKSRALQPTESDGSGFVANALIANDDGDTVRSIPLLGRVSAGTLSQAEPSANPQEFKIDASLLCAPQSADLFALKVQGTSMVDVGIYEDDFVFVRRTDSARHGDIIVAQYNGDATVKRYIPEGNRIRLRPENKQLKDIVLTAEDLEHGDFKILGIVEGLFRRHVH